MKHHLRMLCVEDEKEIRESLKQQFTDENFYVDTAENGVVGLDLLRANHYDIILLDLKMPRMDGMTFLKEMKNIGKNPHVIILTGVDDVSTAIECVKLGARDYISKPYDPEELLHVVIKTLGA